MCNLKTKFIIWNLKKLKKQYKQVQTRSFFIFKKQSTFKCKRNTKQLFRSDQRCRCPSVEGKYIYPIWFIQLHTLWPGIHSGTNSLLHTTQSIIYQRQDLTLHQRRDSSFDVARLSHLIKSRSCFLSSQAVWTGPRSPLNMSPHRPYPGKTACNFDLCVSYTMHTLSLIHILSQELLVDITADKLSCIMVCVFHVGFCEECYCGFAWTLVYQYSWEYRLQQTGQYTAEDLTLNDKDSSLTSLHVHATSVTTVIFITLNVNKGADNFACSRRISINLPFT